MNEFLYRLKQRKLVQWALAYIAAAFAVIQVLDVVASRFDWPAPLERSIILVLAVGFVVALVIAWYHGEKGQQRVSGPELLLIALVLAIGGGAVWFFARGTAPAAVQTLASSTTQAPGAAAGPVVPTATPTALEPVPAKSIAVLPFGNLSNDKDNAYFVAGMQDLILTKLADIGDLKVISRASTAKYASHPDDLKTIGQQLGVATILEGSVQKQGNQVLINVQLLDARHDSHLWAQSYQRTLDNVFGVEGEVAEKVAAALNAKLSRRETTGLAEVPTTNQAAMDSFLRAEFQLNKGLTNYDTSNFRAAIPLYRQAIEEDPNFALAYARVSRAESALDWFGAAGVDAMRLRSQARADAERALQLAPNTSSALLARGYSAYWGRSDYPGALKAFAAALALKPNDVDALAAQGFVERRQGHFDAAIATLRKAMTLDPRNSQTAFELGGTLMMAARYPEAQAWFQRALAIDPGNLNARYQYSNALLFDTGDVARALQAVEGDAAALKLARVTLLTYQRRYRDAFALEDSVPDTTDSVLGVGGSRALQEAALYRLLGDTAKARPLFERARTAARKDVTAAQRINQALVRLDIANAELGLGNTPGGLSAIADSLAITRDSSDLVNAALARQIAAAAYATAGRADLAIPQLTIALAAPGIGYNYSPVLLWLDPVWDPVRRDPRFEALLEKYAKYKPAVIYDTPQGAGADEPHA